MRLWIEHAHKSLPAVGRDACADVVRTFQTEDFFWALFTGAVQHAELAARVADEAVAALKQGASPDAAAEAVLGGLPPDAYVPLSILWVDRARASRARVAHAIECDAPPLFLVQDGQPVLPPVIEDVVDGRLLRRCTFALRDGDYLAMVSDGFLQPRGRRWGWPDIAVAVRRWTDVGCSAGELLDALLRTHRRLHPEPQQDVTVVAVHVRPMRTATVWTGPPADPAQDEAALRLLTAEQGLRIICGGTTAQIAARLLDAELEKEPRPKSGWDEVPPTSRLEGVSLVTEGLVTLREARERMAQDKGQRSEIGDWRLDGATRLARALLAADKVRFVVGLAVNPQQVDERGAPLRKGVVEKWVCDLEARGKLVSLEYV